MGRINFYFSCGTTEVAETEKRIETGTNEALDALGSSNLANGAGEVLSALAIAATKRST